MTDSDKNLTDTEIGPNSKKPVLAVILLAVFAALMAVSYWVYLRWMWYGWFPNWGEKSFGLWEKLTEGDSYYTHGPLVPFICAGLLVVLVKKIRLDIKPSRWWGLGFIVLGQILFLMASFAKIRFVLGWFALLVILGMVIMVWGWQVLRRLWFVFAFAVFAMPMSHVQIAGLSFRLRMLATDMAVMMANAVGIICDRLDNTILLTAEKSMVVGDVCSGLRTLISLLAFGAIYAYICRLRGWKQWVLFLMAVPVGLICNALRIAAIIAVAHFGTVEFAAGPFHDNSGIFIFILAFLIMFGLEKLIMWIWKVSGHPIKVKPLFDKWKLADDEAPAGKKLLESFASRWMVIAIVIIAASGAWGWKLARRPLAVCDSDVFNAAVPSKLMIDRREYNGRNIYVSELYKRILQTDDIFYRQYDAPGSSPVYVMVIYSQENRATTHAPEVCITADGGNIISGRDVTVHVDGIGEVPCHELIVDEGGGYGCYLYTLRASYGYTDNIWKQQAIIFANGIIGRNSSGALIRLSSPYTQATAEQTKATLQQVLRKVLPSLDQAMDNSTVKNLP